MIPASWTGQYCFFVALIQLTRVYSGLESGVSLEARASLDSASQVVLPVSLEAPGQRKPPAGLPVSLKAPTSYFGADFRQNGLPVSLEARPAIPGSIAGLPVSPWSARPKLDPPAKTPVWRPEQLSDSRQLDLPLTLEPSDQHIAAKLPCSLKSFF